MKVFFSSSGVIQWFTNSRVRFLLGEKGLLLEIVRLMESSEEVQYLIPMKYNGVTVKSRGY